MPIPDHYERRNRPLLADYRLSDRAAQKLIAIADGSSDPQKRHDAFARLGRGGIFRKEAAAPVAHAATPAPTEASRG